MKYQIRKCETYTATLGSKIATLNPKDFSKKTIPEEFRYNGDGSLEDFIGYISGLDNDSVYELSDYLNEATCKELNKICGDSVQMEEYYNSAHIYCDDWFEVGKEDESYRKFGGFKSEYNTKDGFKN